MWKTEVEDKGVSQLSCNTSVNHLSFETQCICSTEHCALACRQVPCEIVMLEELLGEQVDLREDFRYLRLLLEDPMTLAQEIEVLIIAKLQRKIGTHEDLELPYHPIVLHIFQACARLLRHTL